MKPRLLAELVVAVPRVAPIQPIVFSAVCATAFVVASPIANAPATRQRVGCAVVAASIAFALDDDARTTLAATPVTRLTQRAVRAGAAGAFLAAWVVVIVAAADALTGVGRPPNVVFTEVGVVALIACAVACLAIGRSDDGRGGIAGTVVAISCFGVSYLPWQWWWPFTPEPRLSRLLLTGAIAIAVALVASLDPARARTRRLARTG
jgi:hypothetical protein